jgi:hypothetical protein
MLSLNSPHTAKCSSNTGFYSILKFYFIIYFQTWLSLEVLEVEVKLCFLKYTSPSWLVQQKVLLNLLVWLVSPHSCSIEINNVLSGQLQWAGFPGGTSSCGPPKDFTRNPIAYSHSEKLPWGEYLPSMERCIRVSRAEMLVPLWSATEMMRWRLQTSLVARSIVTRWWSLICFCIVVVFLLAFQF